MICPVCRDEFRPGFTRCATCDVDLVAAAPSGPAAPRSPATVVSEIAADEPTVSFCGFLSLEEARQARDTLRAARLRAEILITEPQGLEPSEATREEFWLRVAPKDFRAVTALLGYEPATLPADDSFGCSACGATVGPDDAECPGCGLAFEA